MSRIHDALKRAEQGKADQAVAEDAGRTTDAVTLPDVTQEAEVFVSSGSKLPPALPCDAMQFRKLLIERCTRRAWNPDPQATVYFDGRNSALGAEEFRTLRSHLYLIREKQPLQKLLITSPLPLEGKTFSAVNLAQVIGLQPERHVLLLDADLRASKAHLSLGAPLEPGLSDYLSGRADEFSIVQRSSLENFFFIPGGRPTANPSELIGNGRLKFLLQRLGPSFDWIILDSPPVTPVSDAKMLADLCDGVLVVIQSGSTPYDLAQKACQQFREKHLLGVLLNRAEPGQAYDTNYSRKKLNLEKQAPTREGRNQ